MALPDYPVQVNDGGLFDSIAHTTGGMPHLLQYLWDRYVDELERRIEERTKVGQKSLTLDEAKVRAPAADFARWAAAFLAENRVVENFFLDANHGVRLANNAFLCICPGTDVQGTMQESGAVEIMKGRSQPGNEGVQPSDYLRI